MTSRTRFRSLALVSIGCLALIAGNAIAESSNNGASPAIATPVINAAVLPSSRTTSVDNPITVFGTIANAGPGTASQCKVGLAPDQNNGGPNPTGLSLAFTAFDATNTNPIAGQNVPVDIAEGANQAYVLAISGNSPFVGDVTFDFSCDGGAVTAPVITGVNTLTLNNAVTALPDVITIGTSPTKDGVIAIPSLGGGEVMAVAAVNIGSGPPSAPKGTSRPAPASNQAPVIVVPDFGDSDLALDTYICETNPETAVCLSPYGREVKTMIGNQPSTFNVFVNSNKGAGVPFFPGIARQYLRIYEDTGAAGDMPETSKPAGLPNPNAGIVYGATSHAVTSPGPAITGQTTSPVGIWDITYTTSLGERVHGGLGISPNGDWTAILNSPNGQKVYQFGILTSSDSAALPDPTFVFKFDNIERNTTTDAQEIAKYECAGTWRPNNFVQGTVHDAVPPASKDTALPQDFQRLGLSGLQATYNAIYDRSVLISSLAGVYDIFSEGNDIGDLTFDNQGGFTGTVTPDAGVNCNLDGMMFGYGVDKNLFGLDMNVDGCAMADFYIGNSYQFDDFGELVANTVTENVLKMVITSTSLDPPNAVDLNLVPKSN